jgi:hypothetical protein
LLRDFTLQLPVDQDSRDYLEAALRHKSTDPAKNKIRETVTQAFPTRDCVTIVRPLEDETQLQMIDNVPYEKLRPKFREQMERFTDKVFQEAPPKTMRGRNLNGEGETRRRGGCEVV